MRQCRFKVFCQFPFHIAKTPFLLDFDLIYVNQSYTIPFFIFNVSLSICKLYVRVGVFFICGRFIAHLPNCWQHQRNWWNCLENQLKSCSKQFSPLLLRTIGSNIEISMSSIVPLCYEIETTFSLWIRHFIRICVFRVLVFVRSCA